MAGKTLRRRARILVLPLLMALLATAAAPGAIRVRRGDTRWRLARANGLTSERVHTGQVLELPTPRAAGVTFLRELTAEAALDQAIAGYYQGLSSVRKKGMYPDTRRYVVNVLALRRSYGGT
jgi:hypothetical protein